MNYLCAKLCHLPGEHHQLFGNGNVDSSALTSITTVTAVLNNETTSLKYYYLGLSKSRY